MALPGAQSLYILASKLYIFKPQPKKLFLPQTPTPDSWIMYRIWAPNSDFHYWLLQHIFSACIVDVDDEINSK